MNMRSVVLNVAKTESVIIAVAHASAKGFGQGRDVLRSDVWMTAQGMASALRMEHVFASLDFMERLVRNASVRLLVSMGVVTQRLENVHVHQDISLLTALRNPALVQVLCVMKNHASVVALEMQSVTTTLVSVSAFQICHHQNISSNLIVRSVNVPGSVLRSMSTVHALGMGNATMVLGSVSVLMVMRAMIVGLPCLVTTWLQPWGSGCGAAR